jgi:hypothetical protein
MEPPVVPDGEVTLAGARRQAVSLNDVERARRASVLAYCARLCDPARIAEAADAAFAELHSQLEAMTSDRAVDLDRMLIESTRDAAAARVDSSSGASRLASRRGRTCWLMPTLLAARASGRLGASDRAGVERHLARCADCRELARRRDEAEQAYGALLGTPVAPAAPAEPFAPGDPDPEVAATRGEAETAPVSLGDEAAASGAAAAGESGAVSESEEAGEAEAAWAEPADDSTLGEAEAAWAETAPDEADTPWPEPADESAGGAEAIWTEPADDSADEAEAASAEPASELEPEPASLEDDREPTFEPDHHSPLHQPEVRSRDDDPADAELLTQSTAEWDPLAEPDEDERQTEVDPLAATTDRPRRPRRALIAAMFIAGVVILAIGLLQIGDDDDTDTPTPAERQAAAPAPAQTPAAPAEDAPSRADLRTGARLRALGDRELAPGTSGDDVKALQRLLGVSPTGNYGDLTAFAVGHFQARHDLPATGIADEATKRRLARRPRPPRQAPAPPATTSPAESQQQPAQPPATGEAAPPAGQQAPTPPAQQGATPPPAG